MSLYAGEQKEKGIIFSEVNGKKGWTVPKDLWENQILGASADLNAQASSQLPEKYLESHDSIRLMTNQALSYEHLGAYWRTSNSSFDDQTKLLSFVLTENKNALIAGNTGPEDLASNETIQTQLPQIQKVAHAILHQEPRNRRKQVQLILQYLSEHYTYDYDMLKNNVVRPLTTEEALATGKGVCQHYAVIFTALARAMKIPSRIIAGYYLGDKQPGGHAWVEASIVNGYWQVIEPQSKEGLTETHTRFYFPTGRAFFLEDKNVSLGDYIAAALSVNYVFLPNN